MRNDPGRRDQVVTQCCEIETRQQRTAADPGATRAGIHGDAIERGQIDHERIIGNRPSRPTVAATFDSEKQFPLAGEVDRVGDVRGRAGAHDDRRVAVVHSVPDSTRPVVSEVTIDE